jgi:hypothetical protein
VFALSGALHLAAPGFLSRAYERLQFPPQFVRIVATADLAAAAFLAIPATRLWGVVLAAFITFLSVMELLKHGRYSYSVPGLLILAALVPAARAGIF